MARGWLSVVLTGVCLALTGCAAGTPPVEWTAPPPVTPSQGVPLSQMGYEMDAAGLVWLPSGVSLTYSADQPNLLIAVGPASQADHVEAYLRATLPGLGWQITATGDGGLLFEQGQWHGAYALGTDDWALTVRDD